MFRVLLKDTSTCNLQSGFKKLTFISLGYVGLLVDTGNFNLLFKETAKI